ncbi:RICIN domain-containing protein [Actinomadura decatromicini]|uniref:RICIN domain-containing protein n=2 Tax=Actinomadura decatromicini TaxID=2604572 RepID=A0A5D3F4S1_9ACTN|nr:RICIN domain-containing protein [Actinomadura decatromicini]
MPDQGRSRATAAHRKAPSVLPDDRVRSQKGTSGMRTLTTRGRAAAGSMAAVAAAALLVGASAPAHAANPTFISGFLNPTKVIDVEGWSTQDRGRVHLWDLRHTDDVRNQRWFVEKVGVLNGHDVFRFRNALSGKCLDKSEDTPNGNGNAVYQYACHDGNNQKWEKIPFGNDPWTQLRNVAGGRCLDIEGPRWENGRTIHVWDCYGSDGKPAWSQRWNINP